MPVPGGEISTSQIWQQPAQSAEELDAIIDKLIADSDAEEVTEEYQSDDLPELS